MAKFAIGQLSATRRVADTMAGNPAFASFVEESFNRYQMCDWGNLCKEDAEMNDNAVSKNDNRILAAYDHPEHLNWRLWIITEHDRSYTTILFPHEY